MSEKVTIKQLRDAQATIFKWFMEKNLENKDEQNRPITMLHTTLKSDKQEFSLVSYITFYGRDELPLIEVEEDE